MEIFDGGRIYVDESDGDCLNPKFDTSNPMSYYDGTKDGNKATFITNGEPGKWSGELFVVQGDQDSIKVSDLDIGQKQFQVLQTMENCMAAPSMSPSVVPTDLPSYSSIPSMFPTRDPSESPSTKPSSNPSLQPSNIHSSLPSLHPSALHPNACPSDGFLGRIIKSVVFDQCWRFELFSGGQIMVDPTDSTCSETTPHSSTYPLNQFKQNTSNKIVFETIPGATESTWGGYIEILEDTKLAEETLELKKLGWNTNELVFTLTVPLCLSSVPSVRPSLKPSTSPSSKPSTEPPKYSPFTTRDELKQAVNEYCNNPEAWKTSWKVNTYGPIEDWNVSQITDMHRLISEMSCGSPNLSNWDVSKVTNFNLMFFHNHKFNGDISGWNTSSATTMRNMFYYTRYFDGDLSAWDVSSVTDFAGMFAKAWVFNGDISNWDVSSGTNFEQMFHNANKFNRDLSKWDVSNAITLMKMFFVLSSFHQNLCDWKVPSGTQLYGFCDSTPSCGNCDWY